MAYVPQADDPFAGGEKIPSLSWKDLPVGSMFVVSILEPAKLIQSRDFEDGELAFWDAAKTQPKMSAVLNVHVLQGPHSVGEDRSIWAQIPSNLFVALKEAQKVAEARFEAGGLLHLKFIGTKPHDNPRFSPIKQYAAKYDMPAQPPVPDPFTEKTEAPAPAAPARQAALAGSKARF